MSIFETGIRPAVDEYLRKQAEEKRDYGEYWSASSAGYCMRKQIFERLKVPPTADDARKIRVFEVGDIFHEWVQRITKNAGLSIAQELELQDEDLMVRGHIDDLVLVQDSKLEIDPTVKDPKYPHLILYDYKTQNSRAFSYQKDRPMSYYHKMQVGTYMYMLRKFKAPKIPKNLAVIRHDAYDPVAGSDRWGDLSKEVQNELLVSGYYSDSAADWEMPYDEALLHKIEALKGSLTEARVLKISKDDLRMSEQQLLWSPELEQEVQNYWIALNAYWRDKTLPKCTCADHEGGFLARKAYNPFYYNNEPCSIEWAKQQVELSDWEIAE